MNDQERKEVVNRLAAAPEAGDIISGGGGVRKIRIPLESRGNGVERG